MLLFKINFTNSLCLYVTANFENYTKGEYFHTVFDDLLGKGIFNSDGEEWKIKRKSASQIFHVKNFQTEFIR